MSDDRVFAKCAWRLLPLIVTAYLANYLDRTTVGFAALTMNRDLGLTSDGREIQRLGFTFLLHKDRAGWRYTSWLLPISTNCSNHVEGAPAALPDIACASPLRVINGPGPTPWNVCS
jgi:hypothetical protein